MIHFVINLRSFVSEQPTDRITELFAAYLERATGPERDTSAGTLNDGEAEEVYLEIARLGQLDSHLQALFYLEGVLSREAARGRRCSVCLRYDDENCTYDC